MYGQEVGGTLPTSFFVNQCPGRGLGGDFAQVPVQRVCHMQKLFMMIELIIPICKHAAREMEV